MRLTPLFAILVFGAGFTTGLITRSRSVGALQGKDTIAADLAAIEKLHQKDIAVTLAQDPQGLVDIWTEDAVRYSLDPKSPPTTSKQAIAAENQKDRATNPEFKVLSYVPRFKDIQVSGNLACELFEADAQFRLSADGPPQNWHGKGIRVLRRQSDQSWKFVALIWD